MVFAAAFAPGAAGFSRTTSACSGMAMAWSRVPVMMSAEAENPGRTPAGGLVSWILTSKFTASVPCPACGVIGLDPTSVNTPSKVLFG